MHVGALWRQLADEGVPTWAMYRLGGVLSKSWLASAELGWVDNNPFRVVKAPRPPQANEVVPPTTDEVRAMLDACRTDAFRLIVRLAAVTGARRGELIALQWSDIDLAERAIRIRRSVSEVDNQIHVGETKTGRRGHRTVPIDPITADLLAAHNGGDPWVFSHDGPTPWRPNYVTLEFSRTRKRAGVGCSFHGLRHYAATQWLGADVPPSQVSGFLGHSTVAMVFRTYAHFIPAQGRAAINAHAANLD